MSDKKEQDDNALFKAATRGVKPLKVDKVTTRKNKKTITKKTTLKPKESPPPSAVYFSQESEMDDVDANQLLSFRKPGLQQGKFRHLKQAKIPIGATLDLHGLTSEKACTSVLTFIDDSCFSSVRCVLIIHGKGGRNSKPVLKTKLNYWLKQHPAVMAFCSALPKDGGAGAVYVLLKSN